jgi:hypothetical protein
MDLLDLTDHTLEGLCEKCSEFPDQKLMITRILDQLLSVPRHGEGSTAANRPRYLTLLSLQNDRITLKGDIFRLGDNGFSTIASGVSIDERPSIAFDLTREDVLEFDCPPDPVSLERFQERFHPELRKRIGEPLTNCVGYHMHGEPEGVVIGFNYPEGVSRYDGEVMKSLAVTVSALSTLAYQITEIKEGFIYMIESLARASEVNDEDTGNHILRVNTFAKHLAMAMDQPESFCNEIGLVAQMHDVIHTPSRILRKPGPLNRDEWKEMEQHTLQGERILGNAQRLTMARQIACAHHENYDGTGYPKGLKGNQIPLEAQIVKLADVYDALRSHRPYKDPMPHDAALRIIFSTDGHVRSAHFNPALIDVFRREARAFEGIYEKLG